jgi:hypothetical protein
MSWPALKRQQNRLQEAEALLDEGLQKWTDFGAISDLYSEKLKLLAVDQDGKKAREGVVKLSSEVLKKLKNSQGKGSQRELTQEVQGLAFLAAQGLLLTKTAGGEEIARDFLKTDHSLAPYIAMMLYWRLAGENKAAAQVVISERWDGIAPKTGTWQARMEQGDIAVWGEKLIGFYKEGKVPDELFAELEDETRFGNKSDLRHLPKPRLGFLCEAYFYDALLADANGDKARSTASLEKVLATNHASYFEYGIAKMFLAKQPEQKKK